MMTLIILSAMKGQNSPSEIPGILLPAISILLYLTLVARPLSVYVLMQPFRAPLAQQAMIAWVGLRGATSIVFASIATVEDAYTSSTSFSVSF